MLKKYLVLGIISFFLLTGSMLAQTIVKDDFRVNDDFNIGGSNQRMPAIAMDHQGNFVVAWFDERNTSADIYGQRFDRWGSPLGENFKVSDGRGDGKKRFVDNIGLAMDAEGDFVVVWQEYRGGNLIFMPGDMIPMGHRSELILKLMIIWIAPSDLGLLWQ